MTDYLTLTEFVPGTKAKAQEVNANFAAVKDAINTKASLSGDSSQTFSVATATLGSHAVTKGQLDLLSQEVTASKNASSPKFCVKSGNVTSGQADLLTYSSLSITAKVGSSYPNLVISDFEGTFSEISSIASISMTGKPDGTYNIFVKPDGTMYTIKNTIYRQASRPTMVDGDIWLNLSVEPITAIKYDNSSDVDFFDVPIGKLTIASGVITSITTNAYNQNGYDVTTQSNDWSRSFPDYTRGVSKTTATQQAECDGFLFVYGSTSYNYDQYICVGTSSDNVNTIIWRSNWDISAIGGTTGNGILVPIPKGIYYRTAGFSSVSLTFYPAKGV